MVRENYTSLLHTRNGTNYQQDYYDETFEEAQRLFTASCVKNNALWGKLFTLAGLCVFEYIITQENTVEEVSTQKDDPLRTTPTLLWFWEMLYRSQLALGKKLLAERNSSRTEWPGGQTWSELGDSSRSLFLGHARTLAGIPHETYLDLLRDRPGFQKVVRELNQAEEASETASVVEKIDPVAGCELMCVVCYARWWAVEDLERLEKVGCSECDTPYRSVIKTGDVG